MCIWLQYVYINWITSLNGMFSMVRHFFPSWFLCWKKCDAFYMVCTRCSPIWKGKTTVSADLNAVSNSEQSHDFALSFSQIERIDQLFAAGGLRHLMFYYQDVEVAETGIQIWCDITPECVVRFVWGWHEAEGWVVWGLSRPPMLSPWEEGQAGRGRPAGRLLFSS